MNQGPQHSQSGWSRRLIELLHSLGVDTADMLRQCGLDEATLYDVNSVVTIHQTTQLFTLAAELAPRPDWALLFGQTIRMSDMGLWGYALLTCPNLRQAFRLAIDHARLGPLMTGAKQQIQANGDSLIRYSDSSHPDLHRLLIDELMSGMHASVVQITDGKAKLKAAYLDFPAPEYREAYTKVLGCPVYFGSEFSGILVSKATLDTRIPTWDAATNQLCTRQCEEVLKLLVSSESFIDTVKQALAKLPYDQRSADAVAASLHMSSRNLRRKLSEENTSFREILTDFRYQMARDYLGQSALQLGDVAEVLGFSDYVAFSRAFKGWNGQTPKVYRAAQLAAQ